ncbi:MAG: hypothetical protein KIT87_28635, partial [Anaerolineae bacterium]|nr:hypothetical protein [Anaerolineae bacterium]
FRNDWANSQNRNTSWEKVAPSYRYGWENYNRPEYQNMTWDQARENLRTNWQGQGRWEDNEPLVQAGWEKRRTWRTRQG